MQRGIMEINQAAIEAKKQEYLNRKQQVQDQLNTNQVTFIALDGAIQDCDYWLEQLKVNPPETPS
jgi:hypothetical protein